ncbi:MAG: phytoene desaturase family protein [bacterium]
MKYDTIIIGGGHNGLVCAAFLAKSGRTVLLLERRQTLGGAAATEAVFPGCKVNTGAHDAGLFLPEIFEKLDLKERVEFIENPVGVFAPQPDCRALTLWRDVDRSVEEIRRFSRSDADVFPKFVDTVSRMAQVLRATLTLTPPNLSQKSISDSLPWSRVALKLKSLGKREMMQFLRLQPMSIREFLDEWFESDALKGALSAAGVTGSMQGPFASGTAFVWLYHQLGRAHGGFTSSRFVRDGLGKLSEAIAEVARLHGAEIRTESGVKEIIIEDDKATGVLLSNGEELSAKKVISNADPQRTFLNLVGAPNLGPQFVRKVRNIRFQGTTAKINLLLSDVPSFTAAPEGTEHLSGHILICPGLEYLERAYDDAKYGRFSRHPTLDIVFPTVLDPPLAQNGQHLMSVTMQYASYVLRDSTWDQERERLYECVLATLTEYAPGLEDLVVNKQVITPKDLETEYGLTEGSIFHGQMALDQLLFMRPVSGFGRYRTPIENLYLCGAGTHPGGGVTGAPGYNCAREVLKRF